MLNRFLAFLLVGSAVAVFAWTLLRDPTARGEVVAAPASARLTKVEARLAALEKQLGALVDSSRSVATPLATPREAPPVEDEALRARLDRLAARLVELERVAHVDHARREWRDSSAFPLPRGGDRSRPIDDWVAVGRDFVATNDEKLEALRELRGQRLPDGSDARLQVLPEMIALAEASTEERERADVWRQLSGVTDARLLQPLLTALQNDSSAKAREEAAETLADFLPDGAAEAALLRAQGYDEDDGVRRQATRSLASRH